MTSALVSLEICAKTLNSALFRWISARDDKFSTDFRPFSFRLSMNSAQFPFNSAIVGEFGTISKKIGNCRWNQHKLAFWCLIRWISALIHLFLHFIIWFCTDSLIFCTFSFDFTLIHFFRLETAIFWKKTRFCCTSGLNSAQIHLLFRYFDDFLFDSLVFCSISVDSAHNTFFCKPNLQIWLRICMHYLLYFSE